jgi:protocatechuate 3,4-dioxygenase beta subunit
MASSNQRRLRQQSWLLAGLVTVMALSAFLLWHLRRADPRQSGRTVRANAEASLEQEPAPRHEPGVAPPPEAETRIELADEGALPAPPVSVDEFEPGALYGRTLVEGLPEPHVRLFAFADELSSRDTRAPVAETTSDSEGRYRLRGLEPHRRHTLLAQADAVLPHQEVLFPGEPRELELTRAVAVGGSVRARSDGRALAGVEIAFARPHWDGAHLAERLTTKSAADGTWRLPWVEIGQPSFLIQRAGRWVERREFQVTAGGGSNFDILLDDGARLEFVVVDLESGAPLVEVQLLSGEGPVRTDARGLLAVPLASDGSRDGEVRIVLGHPGDVLTEGRLKLGLPGGPLPRVPVARGGRVRGIVLDAEGAPVAEATVGLTGGGRTPVPLGLPEGFALNAPRGNVRTGADGRFELAGCVPRQGDVLVRAQHPRHPSGRSDPFPFARLGLEHEVEIRLERGGSIAGQVTCDGAPLALTVQFESANRSGWVRSNAEGAYRVDGLEAGPVTVRPRREGEWDDEPRPADREVSVAAGETTVCDLALVTDEVTIEGRVLDGDGAPVAGVMLYAYSTEEDGENELYSNAIESERDGTFVLAMPRVGGRLFTVTGEKGPRRVERANVAPGTRALELVLPSLARVAVRVRDALRHEPVQGFRLYWRTSEAGSFQLLEQDSERLSAGPDGRFLAELPVGHLDLVVAARNLGYLPAWNEGVNVAAERTIELDFELEAGVELELVVNGDPAQRGQLRRAWFVSRAQQELEGRGGDFYGREIRGYQMMRPDERGVVRVRGAPPGEYSFERLPKNLRLVPATFEVPAVAQHRLELTLQPDSADGSKPGGSGR